MTYHQLYPHPQKTKKNLIPVLIHKVRIQIQIAMLAISHEGPKVKQAWLQTKKVKPVLLRKIVKKTCLKDKASINIRKRKKL